MPARFSSNCGDPGKASGERWLQYDCELIHPLCILSCESWRAATTLVQEMRQDIYEADVMAEIEKVREDGAKRVRVVFANTLKARPYLPVFVSVAFDNPRFCGAAALSKLGFKWNYTTDEDSERSQKTYC